MSELPSNLKELIGTRVEINPRRLLNKKCLFTVQSWTDIQKLKNALRGIPDIEKEPPIGWISLEKNRTVYTLSDANHRVALACLKCITVPFLINGVWIGGRRYGFNIILNQVKRELGDYS